MKANLEIIFVVIILLMIIIGLAITVNWLKMYNRKYDATYLKKLLDNKELIIDKKDLDYLEKISNKIYWYANAWYINMSPNYWYRKRKIKAIAKKYNIKINVWDYPTNNKIHK